MSEILKVLNRRVELKSEKIELSLIGDLRSELKEGIAAGKEMKKRAVNASKVGNEVDKIELELKKLIEKRDKAVESVKIAYGTVRAMNSRSGKNYEKLINKASDLGVQYPKDIDSDMKELEALESFAKNSYSKLITK